MLCPSTVKAKTAHSIKRYRQPQPTPEEDWRPLYVQNALLVILFTLFFAWSGPLNHFGWINDSAVDSHVLSLNDPDSQDRPDLGHISPETAFVTPQASVQVPIAAVANHLSGHKHTANSIRAPPGFPVLR